MKSSIVLVKPVLTEKATKMASGMVYAFEVAPHATKTEIAEALKSMYKVKITGVRVVTRPGKTRRAGRRMATVKKLPSRKIAYVSVSEGKIDLFPQA